MNNSWYSPLYYGDQWIYGAAALNARIKQAGGMDKLIFDTALEAATNAFNKATLLANQYNDGKVLQMPQAAVAYN